MFKKLQRSAAELKDSLVVCTNRLSELKSRKKSVVKDFNDQIADVEMEISGIISQLESVKN